MKWNTGGEEDAKKAEKKEKEEIEGKNNHEYEKNDYSHAGFGYYSHYNSNEVVVVVDN
jgi:hypothetical protein